MTKEEYFLLGILAETLTIHEDELASTGVEIDPKLHERLAAVCDSVDTLADKILHTKGLGAREAAELENSALTDWLYPQVELLVGKAEAVLFVGQTVGEAIRVMLTRASKYRQFDSAAETRLAANLVLHHTGLEPKDFISSEASYWLQTFEESLIHHYPERK